MLRILVADDSAVNRRLAAALLEEAGHRVQVACHGHEAVRLAACHPFDLILMDVEMPEMDGLTATRTIRAEADSPNRTTPILAATTLADKSACLEAGMDGSVDKPIRLPQLLQTLADVLDGRDGEKSAA